MKTDSLNTERDRLELQETNSLFIVLDSKGLIVSCNDKAKKALSDLSFEQGRSTYFPDVFFRLGTNSRAFHAHEFISIVGQTIELLFIPNHGTEQNVTVSVENVYVSCQQYYSLTIQETPLSFDADSIFQTRQMAGALRADLKNNLLELHYQPQINTVDSSLYGVEVLVRWTNQQLGQVAPDNFIALAEEYGFIAELDLWVLRHACQQLAEWRRSNIHIPVIAVNFSVLTFRYPNLKSLIQSILDENDLVVSDLMVEIIESKKIKPSDSFISTINELYSIGINISLDDFGTGYSNLKRLLKFPISQIKLDRTFVCSLPSHLSIELSTMVYSISKKIGAVAIAEGVETKEQLFYLKNIGYEIIQGYFYSPPLSKENLEYWIRCNNYHY
ncbi:EAL domain-containing protein [Marinomonas rhizomae]|uniref:EAL domain-containing protein (Putative c-di-GMP-specific phosphodiesterase class I) n=1 Tax=Marinomonas rhizomae TaxID=491948 RepID=A0A366J8A6_9GAMM|nr:EAL domain-containing protein [Marinomonas rhizomae]RBP82589.1 EAL domain-containing protein (putative c-di-GMP-specific phosphodiesterase class I) [Marinomonas rhizomae]RNF73626.1 EAL domain-containing protein [Marinomonas rhizomae]